MAPTTHAEPTRTAGGAVAAALPAVDARAGLGGAGRLSVAPEAPSGSPKMCQRGHRIEGLNAAVHSGATRCRACVRARARIANDPELTAEDRDAVAEEFYEAFMAGFETLGAMQRAALVEDVEWMAEHGETLEGAARRVELLPESLYTRLHGMGRDDLYERLVRNERRAAA